MTSPVASTREVSTSPRAGGVAEVALLAFPIVLTQMSQTMMHLVDCIIVGRLGAAELGALGFAGVWVWTVFCVFVGCATGVQTFVSQEHGAGRPRACGPWVWHALVAVAPAGALAALAFAAVADPFFRLLGATPEIHRLAVSYVEVRPWGLAGLGVWAVLAAFFRGLGNTRTPLVATLVANVVNGVLAYGLVLGRFGLPAWGVAGAGVATSIAEWVGAVLLAVAVLRPSVVRSYATAPVRPRIAAIRRFLRTGAPVGGQWLLDMSAFALFTALVARMGNASMAASQAMMSLLSLSFMQAIGVGLAVTTLVGRYKGAGDLQAAARSLRSALKLGMALATAVAALFLLAPEMLLGLYVDDAEVLRLGRPLLVLAAAFQLFDAIQIVTGGALRGAGDTRWPFLVQTLLAWVLRLPLAWLFAVTWQGGVVGAWYAEFVFIAALTGALLWRFQRGPWREVRI